GVTDLDPLGELDLNERRTNGWRHGIGSPASDKSQQPRQEPLALDRRGTRRAFVPLLGNRRSAFGAMRRHEIFSPQAAASSVSLTLGLPLKLYSLSLLRRVRMLMESMRAACVRLPLLRLRAARMCCFSTSLKVRNSPFSLLAGVRASGE